MTDSGSNSVLSDLITPIILDPSADDAELELQEKDNTFNLSLSSPSSSEKEEPDLQLSRKSNLFTLSLMTPIAEELLDYANLQNKPSINGVELVGDSSFQDLGFPDFTEFVSEPLSNEDLDNIIDTVNQEIDNPSDGG